MWIVSTLHRMMPWPIAFLKRRRRPDAYGQAAFLTLCFCLSISVLQAAAPSLADRHAAVQQAEDQAAWANLEAERRATDGDYDGAVQAQQEAERDRTVAQRLLGPSRHFSEP